ncbi:MetQ/NlpA family ABC transporter substrate-binding protein [Tsukamurella sp. 8F]|uniref:MetQ/NlpA family ABC transporter substrate-binding protein n=1 Tax=unclassified Tsukamurella TaxID=2633480 RepID=UPI0023B897D2|nr:MULTISPECIES: MetQ/NlpA family ABC transporter substrate-binding protein [unclassified Tsukamurella]MDF0529627.1 MetQ/NlpA family ABC transporter substrate-binding protein [Tsukamurella sp. 8J]MDF0585912.1 MetQ/NlpA family ABC transporter substrate-binding protein [Tsukamurella sp. 8F]
MTRQFRALTVLVLVLLTVTATTLSACSRRSDDGQIKLGVVDIGQPHWKVFTQVAAEHGFHVRLVSFADYDQPNPALAESTIDLNQFQHVRYLANYNVHNKTQLTPVGATQIYPLKLYSKRWHATAEIPRGGHVALSNNPANQIRPLLSLEAAGLVTFRGGAGNWQSTLADVDRERSKVQLTTLDPTQIGPSLDSVDAGFVDDTFAVKLGLTDKDTIYTDDPDRPDLAQYVNIFAARAGDPRRTDLERLAALYHDERVHTAVLAEAGDAAVFRETSAAELRKTLAQVEQVLRAAK